MRISVLFEDEERLIARVVGLDGTPLVVVLGVDVDWSVLHLIHVSLRHDDDLVATVRVAVDDPGTQQETRAVGPVYVSNEIHDYEFVLNKAVDDDPTGSSIAIVEFAVYGFLEPDAITAVLAYFHDQMRNRTQEAVVYGPGSSGFARPGESDLQSQGDVIWARLLDRAASLEGDAIP